MSWIDDARAKVAEGLVKLAGQGSVPAANSALKVLDDAERREEAEREAGRIDELRDDPPALCRYLGTAGLTRDDATAILGRSLTPAEHAELRAGALERRAMVRHIELARARGGGRVEGWMR